MKTQKELQLSLISEWEALDNKIKALKNFTETEDFKTLSDVEQQYLHTQLQAMATYGCILGVRIYHYDKES